MSFFDWEHLNTIKSNYWDPKRPETRLLQKETDRSVRFQQGIVSDNKDPDKKGRLRIHFPIWGDNIVTDWIPMMRPYSGKDQGLFMLPQVGERVLCIFLNDNANKPIVLGSFYNSQSKPPIDHNKGDVKMITSPKGTTIVLDDTDGKERIEIFAKEGKMRMVLDKEKGISIINELGDIKIKCKKLTIKADDAASIKMKKGFKIEADEIKMQSKKGIELKASGNVVAKGNKIKLKGMVAAMNKALACKGDQVVGVDIHIEMVPAGTSLVPTPMPNPFIGKLDSKVSQDVLLKGKGVATKGTIAKAIGPGHILFPPGVQWQKNPANEGEVTLGTVPTVKVNGKEVACLGSMVKTCADPMDVENGTIIAAGAAVPVPVLVPGMDKPEFDRKGGFEINTRDPFAQDGTPLDPEPRELKNPKWEKDKGVLNEEIKLMVQLEGQYEFASVFFEIYRKPMEGELPRLDVTMSPLTKVAGVQARLNHLGFSCGKVDNIEGPFTKGGIEKFQKEHGLEITGKADKDTKNKLHDEWNEYEDSRKYEEKEDIFVGKIVGQHHGGKAEVYNTYQYNADSENPLMEKPKLYFTAESFRCEKVESKEIEFGAKSKVTIVFDAEKEEDMEAFTEELVVVGADGEEKKVTPDDKGLMEIEDLIPGEFVVMLESEDEEGGGE